MHTWTTEGMEKVPVYAHTHKHVCWAGQRNNKNNVN